MANTRCCYEQWLSYEEGASRVCAMMSLNTVYADELLMHPKRRQNAMNSKP